LVDDAGVNEEKPDGQEDADGELESRGRAQHGEKSSPVAIAQGEAHGIKSQRQCEEGNEDPTPVVL
jgi:hypothetical protein